LRAGQMTPERDLGVVVMTALALDLLLNFRRLLRAPFGAEDEIGLDFEELLKDQRKTLAGGLFQGEHPDPVVIHLEMPAVALQSTIGHVVVQEGVMLRFGKVYFVGSKIEQPLEKDNNLVLG